MCVLPHGKPPDPPPAPDPDPVPTAPPSRKRITPESDPDPSPPTGNKPPPPPRPPGEDLFDALSPLGESMPFLSPESKPLKVVIIPPKPPLPEQAVHNDVVPMPPLPSYSPLPPLVSQDEEYFTIRSNLDAFVNPLKTVKVSYTFDDDSFPPTPEDYYSQLAPSLEDYYFQPALLLPTSPSAKMVGAGVVNLGNTCFMGAILQCFTHTVPLLQGLRSCPHNYPCVVAGFCVICAFRQHFDSSLHSSRAPVDPTMLINNLHYFSSSFVRHQQEDAHEFMQCALDKLRRCFPNGEDNLIEKLFGGRLLSKLRCCSCGHSSDTYEPLIDLSLEIENVNTLQLALESFTKVEKMDEKFKCASCNEDVSMEKQFMLDQTPSVAAFHLKRFKRDGNSVQKIGSHLSFTMELDLQPYTSTRNANDNVLLKYDLYAIVEHTGSTPNSGHYFCFIRSAPDKWHRMDDSVVTTVSEDVVLSHVAYILFYARKGTPWFSSIVEGEQSDPKSVLDNKQNIGEGQKSDPKSVLDNKQNIGEGQKSDPKSVLDNKQNIGNGQNDNDSTDAFDTCVSDIDEECDPAHTN